MTKTIKIHGKDYVPVSERVKEFHEELKDKYDERGITTELVSNTDKMAIVKATVTIGTQTYTGYSQAEWSDKGMGKVALENAETSAIGRALGFAGFGIVDGIASADEINKADFNI